MITLIDNYDSFTYNLVHYLGELGAKCRVYRNDKVTVEKVVSETPSAIVISPGPCDPDQAGICLDLIKETGKDIPILGVCLGFQAVGQAYGGKVVRAPELMHGKVSTVHHRGKGLFSGLPRRFEATRYHSLMVASKGLPDSLIVTAKTGDGIIMGMQHKKYPVHGVQFHPESIASEYGHELLKNFLEISGIRSRDNRKQKHA